MGYRCLILLLGSKLLFRLRSDANVEICSCLMKLRSVIDVSRPKFWSFFLAGKVSSPFDWNLFCRMAVMTIFNHNLNYE